MSLSAGNADLTQLLPSATKLLAHSDLCIKKIAGHILTSYGRNNPEMILLAINTLLKDCQDSSPMVRGLALKILCSLQEDSILEHMDSALKKGFNDKSAYVRRAAVLGSVKVFHFSSSFVRENNIIDKLYSMIRDNDPIVVVNCLSALEEILHNEGGIVLNKNIAHYLLNRLNDFPMWSQIELLTLLKKYSPVSEDEIFSIMNVLDPFLKHNCCPVVCCCLQLFLHITKLLPDLENEICRRSKEFVVSHLGSGNVELVYAVLDFLSSLSKSNLAVFASDFQRFFCRYKEPQYLKVKKMNFLPKLLNTSNEDGILDELSMYCTDSCQIVSACAVNTVTDICRTQDHLHQRCVDIFQSLLESSSGQVVSNVLRVLQKMPVQDKGMIKDIMTSLGKVHKNIEDVGGNIAFLHLLGEYGREIEDLPYILEDFVDKLEDIHNSDFKQQLLTTLLQVFFSRPGETQHILGVVLESCMNDTEQCVKDQAEFYYTLLESSVDDARFVVCGTHSEVV